VTCLAAGNSLKANETSNLLISGSRDKTVIIWDLTFDEDAVKGKARKQLTGHSHFISDLAISGANSHFISASWDKTLRLWTIANCDSIIMKGHEKEVLSVSLSHDSRILSCGADKTVRLWNSKGDERHKSGAEGHKDWVSCVRFMGKESSTKSAASSYFATAGWDGRLKIWSSLDMTQKDSFKAHEGNINHISVSPFGKYIATGGKDQKLAIWNFDDTSKPEFEFLADASINQIAFNPQKEIIVVATEDGIQMWRLTKDEESLPYTLQVEMKRKESVIVEKVNEKNAKVPKVPQIKYHKCTSLCWDAVGKYLFAGFTDGIIRVYTLNLADK
jgi:guanine nucleotide-binding protein subunit beta-2-like 1 protein